MAVITILSEVAGVVWQVSAQVGQSLEPDEAVVIVESMKMELPVCTPKAGKVLQILVSKSDVVAAGDPVARLDVE
ncbi:MAG: acetyl-CoA carboxylase biotin carboxyl carrier protein [Halioglobus sp.]|jgi:acetyl-CoA carboxylase biotin carboxyl carrier protein